MERYSGIRKKGEVMLQRILSGLIALVVLIVLIYFALKLINPTQTKTVTETQTIPRTTQTVTDTTLAAGATAVQQAGSDGTKQVTYKITTKKGAEIKRETVSEKVITSPQPKVVLVSDKTTPQTGPEDSAAFILAAVIGAFYLYKRSRKRLRLAMVPRA